MKRVDIALEDGSYDAFVVWAETRRDDDLALELAITTGAHKGDVVHVRATNLGKEALDVVGLPCTLVVEHGSPRVRWEG
jgi:hypothetical protein